MDSNLLKLKSQLSTFFIRCLVHDALVGVVKKKKVVNTVMILFHEFYFFMKKQAFRMKYNEFMCRGLYKCTHI